MSEVAAAAESKDPYRRRIGSAAQRGVFQRRLQTAGYFLRSPLRRCALGGSKLFNRRYMAAVA